jgi:hypothetical protein
MAAGARRRLFQVSLAEQVSGEPLTAITGGSMASTAVSVDFIAGDLNGRHTDELVVFSPSTVTIFSADE